MTAMYPRRRLFSLPLPIGELRLGERPLVMGILNVTPDSFAEAESRIDSARSVELALQMEAHGADLIDIGVESTRPGSDPLSLEEELARVFPVVRERGKRLRVPISIDTYKAGVAKAALDLGASLVNDVSGLRFDPALAKVVAEHSPGLIVMHTRARTKAMYSEATYENVLAEVASELKVSLDLAQSAGVLFERIVVDPG